MSDTLTRPGSGPTGARPGPGTPGTPGTPDTPGTPGTPDTADPAGTGGRGRRPVRGALVLGALGVVYGDIGTSPLYALQTVFAGRGARLDPTAVFGVVSFVFWSILLIASVKYVLFVLRADNDGEGGVMALAALARRAAPVGAARAGALVLLLGAAGAALFYGDGVITPAISVLSAVEGLQVASPGLGRLVVPIAVVILVGLFSAQHWGTQRVGRLFGPVMLVWFGLLGLIGGAQVAAHPQIVRGLSPSYAVRFAADRPGTAFVAMGAVVLAITGVEALYADLGHFGRPAIRLSWFALVFPALTLNYLAQGALLLRRPAAAANPFFLLFPRWAQLPMVVLATVATVIASQAVISGAFSMSEQAVKLGFLPYLRVRHTSARAVGQVFLPAVNAALFVGTLLVVVTFGSSSRLAAAYGVAVTGTFLITTALYLTVARWARGWGGVRMVAFGLAFGVLELVFFTANLTKVAHGGWLTLLIAVVLFTVMTTWRRGRGLVTTRRAQAEGPLPAFLADLRGSDVSRAPGVAVFPHPDAETAPLALRANVRHNHVLHAHTVLVTAVVGDVPHVAWRDALEVRELGDDHARVLHVRATFGFLDGKSVPEVLDAVRERAALSAPDVAEASFFLSRITLERRPGGPLRSWRKRLFIALAHNAASQADDLCLPADRTVVLSSSIPV